MSCSCAYGMGKYSHSVSSQVPFFKLPVQMQLVVLVFNGSGVPLSERSILGKHVVDRRPVMQLQSPDSVGRFTSSYSTVINDWLRPPLTVNVIGSVDVWGIRRRLEAVRMGVLSLWGTRLSQAK